MYSSLRRLLHSASGRVISMARSVLNCCVSYRKRSRFLLRCRPDPLCSQRVYLQIVNFTPLALQVGCIKGDIYRLWWCAELRVGPRSYLSPTIVPVAPSGPPADSMQSCPNSPTMTIDSKNEILIPGTTHSDDRVTPSCQGDHTIASFPTDSVSVWKYHLSRILELRERETLVMDTHGQEAYRAA